MGKGGFSMIRTNEEILQRQKIYTSEKHNGIKCGIPNLDDILRLERKRFTIITSTANVGKTTFLNFYCYQMAKTNNFKTLFFVIRK